MKKSVILLVLSGLIIFLFGGMQQKKHKDVIIFHAGSLTVPFKAVAKEYEKRNREVSVLTEAAGSLVCARKVTELKKPCDIIASADYYVINELLIPRYTTWSIRFATNQIVIAYTGKSRYALEIDSSNWKDILLKDDVTYSRSDPNADPGGYRTVLTLLLAEKYYNQPGLAAKFLLKNKDFIRPKEVDLVALMESNAVDYMFQYKSVALQHKMKYIELPAAINLSDPRFDDHYHSVSTEVTGSTPGSKIKITGECINYSLTVLNNAPEKDEAIRFVSFLLGPEGMRIFRNNGQDQITPASSDQADRVPVELQKYLKK